MTPWARTALEYVHNSGGNATLNDFMADHGPVGVQMWEELRGPVPLVEHDRTPGRGTFIVLTEAGRRALSP